MYKVSAVVCVQSPECCQCTDTRSCPCTKSRLLYVYRVQIDVCVQSPKCRGSTDCCQCTGSWFLPCKEVFFVFRDQIAVRAKRQNYIVQRPDCCQNTETRLLSEYRDHIVVRVQRLDCCQCTEESISLCVQRTNFLSSHELSLFKFKSCLISTLQFLYSKGVPPKIWFDCRIIWWKNNLVQPLVVTLP